MFDIFSPTSLIPPTTQHIPSIFFSSLSVPCSVPSYHPSYAIVQSSDNINPLPISSHDLSPSLSSDIQLPTYI